MPSLDKNILPLSSIQCLLHKTNILLEEEEETGVILEDYSFYEAGIELMIILNLSLFLLLIHHKNL